MTTHMRQPTAIESLRRRAAGERAAARARAFLSRVEAAMRVNISVWQSHPKED